MAVHTESWEGFFLLLRRIDNPEFWAPRKKFGVEKLEVSWKIFLNSMVQTIACALLF
jgi:hypothetical protein